MSADWKVVYLRALGAKPTAANVAFLSKWQPFEGGATNNNAHYNYFNTTEKMPGSTSINSVGVQSYGSLAQGAQAFARTLKGMPAYAGLVNELRAGTGVGPGAVAALSTWLSGQPDSDSGVAYAHKILGSDVGNLPQSTTPAPAATESVAPDTAVAAPAPDIQAQNAATIRAAARQNLSDIATGAAKPTDEVAGLATLRASLPGIAESAPALKTAAPQQNLQGDSLDAAAVSLANKYRGVKYTYGGTSAETGFDCSGLVQTVWGQLGVKIPRTTYDQWDAGTPVAVDQLKPGDAVFFTGSNPKDGKPGHEGMYIGDGKFIEAPHTGAKVRVSTLAGRTDYVGARRFSR